MTAGPRTAAFAAAAPTRGFLARGTPCLVGARAAPGGRLPRATPARVRAQVNLPKLPPQPDLVRPVQLARSDWAPSLLSLPRSKILELVTPQVLLSFAFSSAVVVGYTVWAQQTGNKIPPLPTAPHSFMATAVSLTLVFRTNAAYDRYWEGRKLWGAMVNSCRNMGRLCTTSMKDPESARCSCALVAAFAWGLAQRLQCRSELQPIQSLLAPWPEYEAKVRSANSKPLMCLQLLGEVVQRELTSLQQSTTPGMSDMQKNVGLWNAEECVREMVNHLGACERICTCPVPLSYSRHTTRMISIFVLTLPFVLVGLPGGQFMTVPVCSLITWAYCGVDEVARLIEDPFVGEKWSLDIDVLCGKIERDLLYQICPLERLGPQAVAAGQPVSSGTTSELQPKV